MGNILSAIIKSFRPIKQLGQYANRARIFCAYETLYEVIFTIINYAVFSVVNQLILNHMFLIFSFLSANANYLTSITHPMRFLYSACLNIISGLINTILTIIVITRLINVAHICKIFSNYDKRQLLNTHVDFLETCSQQRLYYIIWVLINLLTLSIKGLAIYFSIKAHNRNKFALIKEKKDQRLQN
jgi:hypothetical protein